MGSQICRLAPYSLGQPLGSSLPLQPISHHFFFVFAHMLFAVKCSTTELYPHTYAFWNVLPHFHFISETRFKYPLLSKAFQEFSRESPLNFFSAYFIPLGYLSHCTILCVFNSMSEEGGPRASGREGQSFSKCTMSVQCMIKRYRWSH